MINLINGAYLIDRKSSEYNNIFISNGGKPMGQKAINGMLKKLAKRAEIDKNITAHSLRHSLITELIDQYGIEKARQFIGHSNITTTQVYSHTNEDTIRNMTNNITL